MRDLTKARRLYELTLGFEARAGGEGWADLDAGGTVLLRLVEVARPETRASILRAPAHSSAPARKRACRQRSRGRGRRRRRGNSIQIWRALTEDEYDLVPELPKELTWAPDAEVLLKSLLKSVPALFRALARRRVLAIAEELAMPTRLVTREDVIRGLILASPKVTRGRNRQPLIDHGVDVDRYRADWEGDQHRPADVSPDTLPSAAPRCGGGR